MIVQVVFGSGCCINNQKHVARPIGTFMAWLSTVITLGEQAPTTPYHYTVYYTIVLYIVLPSLTTTLHHHYYTAYTDLLTIILYQPTRHDTRKIHHLPYSQLSYLETLYNEMMPYLPNNITLLDDTISSVSDQLL